MLVRDWELRKGNTEVTPEEDELLTSNLSSKDSLMPGLDAIERLRPDDVNAGHRFGSGWLDKLRTCGAVAYVCVSCCCCCCRWPTPRADGVKPLHQCVVSAMALPLHHTTCRDPGNGRR